MATEIAISGYFFTIVFYPGQKDFIQTKIPFAICCSFWSIGIVGLKGMFITKIRCEIKVKKSFLRFKFTGILFYLVTFLIRNGL